MPVPYIKQPCPSCRTELAIGADTADLNRHWWPDAGQPVVCFSCSALLVMGEDGLFREAAGEERARLIAHPGISDLLGAHLAWRATEGDG